MDRVAVFVDAGYLFAQGSVALMGSKQPRSLIDIDEQAAIAKLRETAEALSGLPLLRIYWYDGASPVRGPTTEHARLAQSGDLKLRLGFLNSAGEQKGVDALIVTDLIDLARNKAMADAVLVSGDEDVRIGVQVAQSYGVRVHLVGIEPARASQSAQLLNEADTTTEWSSGIVAAFLALRPATGSATAVPAISAPAPEALYEAVIVSCVHELLPSDVDGIKAFWATGERGIPREFDGRLLARCREVSGRDLAPQEKRQVRSRFAAMVTGLTPAT